MNDDNGNNSAAPELPTADQLSAFETQTLHETETLATFLNQMFMAFMHGHEKLTITASMAGGATFLARSMGAILDYHADYSDANTFARFQSRALEMIKRVEASVAEIRHVTERGTH